MRLKRRKIGADEMLDQLLLLWREQYDQMMAATANQRNKLESTQQRITELEQPYKIAMEALHDEIEPLVMVKGATYNDLPNVRAEYRGGYWRTSYDTGKVDTVSGMLQDLLPSAAEQLQLARKQTPVSPKVTVKPKEG
jgi:predicted patatin/cPLA2 family phospholipase